MELNSWEAWSDMMRDATRLDAMQGDATQRLRARVLAQSLFALRRDARIIYQSKLIDRARSKLWKFCGCTETRPFVYTCVTSQRTRTTTYVHPRFWSIVYFWLAHGTARRRETFHFSTFPTNDPLTSQPSFSPVTTEIFYVVSFSQRWLTVVGRLSLSSVIRLFFSLNAENFFAASRLDWTNRNATDARDRWTSNSRWTGIKRKLVTSHSRRLISRKDIFLWFPLF